MRRLNLTIVRYAIFSILLTIRFAHAATVQMPGSLMATIDQTTGSYEISASDVGWTFTGNLKTPLTNLLSQHGTDGIGDFAELTFDSEAPGLPAFHASIRVYSAKPVALFTQTYATSANQPAEMFPAFTTLPANLHAFSHRNYEFSPPVFSLGDHNMPWVLFDDAANTWIMSPASHFLASRMAGDGLTLAGSGLNADVTSIPAGYQQRTLLAVAKGINPTWDLWGLALTDLQGKTRPASDADIGLKYFGYWTDNGANYYYNYDPDKAYAGTLLALMQHYQQQHIPLGYMQLDSWWYYKSLNDPAGVLGHPKSPTLPQGEWNRYGGLLEYKAHTYLFPNGLAAFQKQLGLPLITHNRWIDRASPYHQKYKITGVAAVDPKWWDDIIAYLQSSGVVTYEQDWLNQIFINSPRLSSTVDQGDAFLDNMARACKDHGLTMQYCMPLPCEFLQGSKYGNLTTIRVSGDKFSRDRWTPFLFTSRLASALGMWPWVDVFRSTDRDSMLLADLSAGMVGIGDAIGHENRANIMMAIRPDGVIVKPDAPLVPTDQTYVNLANGKPDLLIASAYSDHAAGRTAYVFAYSQSKTPGAQLDFSPADLGIKGDSIVFDTLDQSATSIRHGSTFDGNLGADGMCYYIVAPFGKSGIAFLGDQDKFVSMGKQRIAEATDESGRLTIQIIFTHADNPLTLHGYVTTNTAPHLATINGIITATSFDAPTKHFTLTLRPADSAKDQSIVTVLMDAKLR